MIYYLSAVKRKNYLEKDFLNKGIEEQVVTKKSYQQKKTHKIKCLRQI